MNTAFKNLSLLGNIVQYLNVDELKYFSMVNKRIRSNLKRENNKDWKRILIKNFMEDYNSKFSEADLDKLNIETKRYINDYINNYENNLDDKMEETNEPQEKMKLISKIENNEIKEFLFSYHIYLPDLRKNEFIPDLEISKLLITKFYDYNSIHRKNLLNFYDKYIREEFITDSNEEKEEISSKENKYNEKEILDIKKCFQEIKENISNSTEYLKQIEYMLNKIEFKNMYKEDYKKINRIIYLIWVTALNFQKYFSNSIIYIHKFKNNLAKKKFFNGFIELQKDVLNLFLFIDTNLNKENLIQNNCYQPLDKVNKENEKDYPNLLNQFIDLFPDEEIFLKNNKKCIIDTDLNHNTHNRSNSSEEVFKNKIKNEDNKNKIKNLIYCVLDLEILSIILGKVYQKFNNFLKESEGTNIEEDLKEKSDLKTPKTKKDLSNFH